MVVVVVEFKLSCTLPGTKCVLLYSQDRTFSVLQFSDVILTGSRMLPDTERLSVEISRIDDLPYGVIVGVLVRELEAAGFEGGFV